VAVFSALSHIIYSLNLPVYVSIPLAVLTVFLQWLTYCALRSGRCAWFKFYNRNNKKGRVLFWFKPKYSAKSMRFYLSLFLRKSGWTFLLLLPGVFTATSFVLLAADGGIELNLFLCGIIGGGVMLILGMAFRFLIIQKYFLAQYLFVSDPKIKVRDALRQSTALMNGKLKKTALFKLSYGLFILTAKDEEGRDNGCIINTAFQVANDPTKIAISCQMGNLTREIIEKTGKFNLSVLTEDLPFETVQHFGMRSGRDVNKFEDFEATSRSHNGLNYITENTNAFFSCEVKHSMNLGSHQLFIADVTESAVLSKAPSCTYAHYHKVIKKKF
jgi:flavin reductase (DIM6/NTAB) family NADH-FMN oxidoreductase RutF